MVRRRFQAIVTAGTLSLTTAMVFAAHPAAADLPKEGDFRSTFCFVGDLATVAQSKTDLAFSFELTGPVRGETPGSLLDRSSVRCVGMGEVRGGKRSGVHQCQFMDPDGDQVFARFEADGSRTTFELVGGSGKYAGISGAGETESLGSFPKIKEGTFQGCTRGGGRYRLP